MSTTSTDLFPPLEDTPALHEELRRLAQSLDDLVTEGVSILSALMGLGESAQFKARGNALAVIILQVRWYTELLGSVGAQVRSGWIEPSEVTLRSMFEASLGLRYLCSEDGEIEGRAKDYLYMDYRAQLAFIDAVDASSSVGKQLRAKLRKDRLMKNVAHPALSTDAIKRRRGLLDTITSTAYASQHEDFQTRARASRKPTEWFSLRGGPANIEDLAAKVGASGLYEMFYRSWSRRAHGRNVVAGKLAACASVNMVAFKQLRDPNSMYEAVSVARTLALDTYQFIIETFLPELRPSHHQWYMRWRVCMQGEPRITVDPKRK